MSDSEWPQVIKRVRASTTGDETKWKKGQSGSWRILFNYLCNI